MKIVTSFVLITLLNVPLYATAPGNETNKGPLCDCLVSAGILARYGDGCLVSGKSQICGASSNKGMVTKTFGGEVYHYFCILTWHEGVDPNALCPVRTNICPMFAGSWEPC